MSARISLCTLLLCWLRLTILYACFGTSRRYFDASHCQKLSIFGSQQPVWGSKRSTVSSYLHRAWLHMGGAKLHAKVSILATWGPWTGQQMSQGTLRFTSILLRLPSLCQTYSWKSLFLTGLWWNWENGTSRFSIRGRSHSYFREDGWCVPPSQSHRTESVPEYFSDFGRAEPLISSLGGSGGGCSAGS